MSLYAEYIGKIGSFLWTPVMLVVLVGSSIILSIKFKFFQITHTKQIYKETVKSLFVRDKNKKKKRKNGVSPFEAVSAALAGTMGVGNIAGVATAITAGGAGAIFWMWFSAFLCMIVKYCEVVLSQLYKLKKGDTFIGGPMYYISEGMNNRALAALFSVLCILSSFGIGNMSQSNTIAESVESAFGIRKIVTGVVIALIVAVIIIGGVRRIVSFTSKFIPFMSLFYMIIASAVVIANAENLTYSIKLIFTEAFSLKSAGGGIMGFGISRAIRFGISRGIFTNEAGLGSAPIAHATAESDSPVKQGMWGIFEVFFDTIVVCTITALAIITTNVHTIVGLDGINLTNEAFGQVFSFSNAFLAVSITFFAVATLVSWSFYGECCIMYLFAKSINSVKQQAVKSYKICFILLIIVGAVIDVSLVWSLSDIFNVLMALPNIAAVFVLSPQVYTETVAYLKSERRIKNSVVLTEGNLENKRVKGKL